MAGRLEADAIECLALSMLTMAATAPPQQVSECACTLFRMVAAAEAAQAVSTGVRKKPKRRKRTAGNQTPKRALL